MTFINKEDNSSEKKEVCLVSNAINTSFAVASNLTPHFWYYKIINKQGTPDLPCIMILSELFGWFRNLKKSRIYYSTGLSVPELVNNELAISYEFLSKKLNFQKERIRRNMVKLETLTVLNRDVRNITLPDGSRVNQLYISINRSFFQSCLKHPNSNMKMHDNKDILPRLNSLIKSPLQRGDIIVSSIKNNNIRSIASKKVFEVKEKKRNSNSKNSAYNLDKKNTKGLEMEDSLSSTRDQNGCKRYKHLKDFYPISLEDCYNLQKLSGREFSLNAMNEILKNMSKRLVDRIFYSKKGFLSYMSKVFKYEKRDAQKTNSSNFKIVSNLSKMEKTVYMKEKYLSEIESYTSTTPEWNLKRKLASVLERDKAYELLISYKGMRIKDNGLCCMLLNRPIELSKLDKQVILSQVRATHNRKKNEDGVVDVKSMVFSTSDVKDVNLTKKPETNKKDNITQECQKTTTTWERIKTIFATSIGKEGDAINKNWLSKLEADTDETTKIVNLKAPGDFVKDFIEERYISHISRVINHIGFRLGEFTCKETRQIIE